jgi:head-tail adaptor
MISGGLLKFIATRLTPSTSRDSLGMRLDSWVSSGTFRADLREQSASEQSYADGVAVVRSCEVRARWSAVQGIGLTEVDRLSVRGRTLKVNSIQNLDEADRVAVISCTEVN